jgi:hypothetical protein
VLAIVVSSIASHAAVAGAQTPPPDDGAPPDEYVPREEGRSIPANGDGGLPANEEGRSAPADTGDLSLSNAELPQEPPADNVFPIAGRSGSSCANSFGAPRWPDRIHMGDDCFAPLGTPLVAVESGTIRYATPTGPGYDCATGAGDGSGNRVSVRGVSGYVYYYGHLDQILVDTDQPVLKGQVIGTVGRTGNAACSTPHLHFEAKCGENGPPFDPYPWLTRWRTASGPASGWPSNTEGNGAGFVFSGPNRADLFALECGRAIRQRAWQVARGGLIPGWIEMPHEATADPDAASPGAGATPQIYYRGPDYAAWQMYFNGSYWDTLSFGGLCTSAPTAVYSGNNRADVFCRGWDMSLYIRTWFQGYGWHPWYRVGGVATSDPDAASAGPGSTPQIYVRGGDNALYQGYWDGSTWQFISLGGLCTSGPTAAYAGPNRVDVYCRGWDMAIYHRQWRQGVGWTGWARIDSQAISAPEASSEGPGSAPQVFARGVDRRLWQYVWNGSGWSAYSWGLT